MDEPLQVGDQIVFSVRQPDGTEYSVTQGAYVRGDGYISHSSFNTQTFNGIATYAVTPDDRVTFKVINNLLFGNLSVRLSLNQFFLAAIAEKVGEVRVTLQERAARADVAKARAVLDRVPDEPPMPGDER